jgi:hypothetical protein
MLAGILDIVSHYPIQIAALVVVLACCGLGIALLVLAFLRI